MRTARTAGRVALALGSLAQLACHQVILTAPPGSTLVIFANPAFVPANGGISVITAIVIEPAGTLVPDGTVVQFFTNLGRIDEQGKTNDGVARVNFVSDSRSGTATVTAVSGAATTSTPVTVGAVLPARVIVTASPTRLTDSRTTQVVANVFDTNGNAVANVPIVFTVSATPLEEFMESGGAPVFTDQNGQARDVMRTRRARDATQKTATITATTSNGQAGTVTVTIN